MLSAAFTLLLTLAASSVALVMVAMLFAHYFPRLLDVLGL